ncbi:hypothetical protein B0H13DRAFT_2403714 [Mycena leptocephala]|nr:hypothetical protein B0H13DRAFT_2403714 [Mycena leptocephala]
MNVVRRKQANYVAHCREEKVRLRAGDVEECAEAALKKLVDWRGPLEQKRKEYCQFLTGHATRGSLWIDTGRQIATLDIFRSDSGDTSKAEFCSRSNGGESVGWWRLSWRGHINGVEIESYWLIVPVVPDHGDCRAVPFRALNDLGQRSESGGTANLEPVSTGYWMEIRGVRVEICNSRRTIESECCSKSSGSGESSVGVENTLRFTSAMILRDWQPSIKKGLGEMREQEVQIPEKRTIGFRTQMIKRQMVKSTNSGKKTIWAATCSQQEVKLVALVKGKENVGSCHHRSRNTAFALASHRHGRRPIARKSG